MHITYFLLVWFTALGLFSLVLYWYRHSMAFPSIQPSLSLAQGMHFLSNFARPCTLLQIHHCFNRSGMAQSDKHRLHDPRDPGSIPTTGSTVFFFYSPMVMTIIRESRLFCSEFWVDYRWHQWQAEWKLHFIDMNNAPSRHFAYSRLKLLFQLWGLRELDKWLFIGIFFGYTSTPLQGTPGT